VDPLSGIRIDVVDNGGQWTHREWRVLKYIGVETNIIPNTTPLEEIEADGLVFSGGAPRVNIELGKLGSLGDYLDDGQIPVLAICVGLHFMSLYYGGEAGPAPVPEFGRTEIEVLEEDILLKGVPERFIAWESHNDEVKVLPDGFRSIARSESCAVQAVAHDSKPWFGTQFHPEVEQTEHGYDMFKNFMGFVEDHRKA
jgi:GMP synthase (glutamine-hydrolysing)